MGGIAHKSVVWVSVAAAALVAAAAVFLYSDYRVAVERHRKALLERGSALAEALEAGMRAQGRMARARGDRVVLLFEEAAHIPGVQGVRLTRDDGSVVAAFGATLDASSPPSTAPAWTASTLTLSVPVNLLRVGETHPEEMHGGPWHAGMPESVPAGSYAVTLMLDASAVHQEVLRERVRYIVALTVATCAVVLGAGLLLQQMRRMSLESDLAMARALADENERLAQLGAGLAHETKNPLNVVRGLAQNIADATAVSQEAHRDAMSIVDEVDRTVGHINGFLSLSRPKPARLEPLPLDAFLKEVVSLVGPEARQKGIELEARSGGEVILADRELLRRAMLNLLINALRACSAGCRVRAETTRSGAAIGLSVIDTGCGIAPDDLPRVKEPYFSRFEGGTGLGLAIVDQVAQAHSASLAIAPREGGGTCVRLDGFRAAG